MSQGFSDKKLIEARRLLENYDLAPAVQAYQRLCQQFPNKPEIWFEYGCAACKMGEFELAEKIWQKTSDLASRNGQVMLQIGHQYRGARRPEEARQWFEKAAANNPKDINPRMALAILFEQNHRFDEARQAVATCLAIDPRDDQARYYEAFLDRRQNKLEDAEKKFQDLRGSNPQHQYVQYACRYELAEILDRTGRFDEAWQMLGEAKSLVRRLGDIPTMLREYDADANQYKRSTAALPRDILRRWEKEFPQRSRESILNLAFLGGHPRSGTTLLEQILGAHPKVAALDEPRPFTTIAAKLLNESQHISPPRLNVIRRKYIEAIQREWGGSLEGKLALDKNPSPTAKLRIWLRLFPELRVVVALRDPRDVVVSCFFQNLPLNPFNGNFLDLPRTVVHYSNIMDVWLAVRQWEGLNGTETRYEDVVSDLEKEGRRVTEFLGLTWDDAQAKYYEKSSKKLIHAPTYRDASQPLYTRAVARWKAYEKHLAPILPMLEPYLRAFGYS